MLIKKTKQRFQLTLYVLVTNTLVLYLMQPSVTYSVFVGEYPYQEFISYLKSGDSCGFIPLNISLDISTHLENEQSKSEDICIAFITTVANMSTESRISNVKVKYFAFDMQYTFEPNPVLCTNPNLQNVMIILICQGKTAIRHLYQTCDEYSPCDGDSECRALGSTKICQCMDGYMDINGSCVKSNRRLYESCELSNQCTGSHGANECKVIAGVKMCYCPKNTNIFEGKCLRVGLTLDEQCYVHGQCTGTTNSGVCMADQTDNGKLICQCAASYLRHKDNCLQGGRKLFEACSNNQQCTGTYMANNCTDLHVDNNTVCLCRTDYMDFEGRCFQAGKKLNKTCKTSQQCTGTENANTCRFVGGTSICTCNDGFDLINGSCLKIGKKLFESCIISKQCNGTNNAQNCTDTRVDSNNICFCQDGYLEYQGRCIQDKRNLGDVCIISLQCTGTENAGICGKNQTCTYDEGFVRSEDGCLPEKETLFLIIAVGGFFGIMTCSLTTSFAMKRINSRKKRQECHSSSPVRNDCYSIVDNSAYESTTETTAKNRQRFRKALAENIYDEAYQRDEQDTENVYSCSEPQCYGTQNDNDIYNHLHQKPIQMSDAIYGVPKSMSESMCSKMQEHRL